MENKKTNEWKDREVGALWKRKGANTSYCTGYIVYDEFGKKVQQRVVMFSNKNKNKENSPDFILYISKENEEGKPKSTATATAVSPARKQKEAVAAEEPSLDDDNVPM